MVLNIIILEMYHFTVIYMLATVYESISWIHLKHQKTLAVWIVQGR